MAPGQKQSLCLQNPEFSEVLQICAIHSQLFDA
jgi:hypothetical protein